MKHRIPLERYLSQGDPLPRLYRQSWIDFNKSVCVCYPIGIHWIAKHLHRLWHRFMWYRPSRRERELISVESIGRHNAIEWAAKRSSEANESMLDVYVDLLVFAKQITDNGHSDEYDASMKRMDGHIRAAIDALTPLCGDRNAVKGAKQQ